MVDVVTVRLQRPFAQLTRSDLALTARDPPAGDLGEAQLRRDREHTPRGRLDQRGALLTRHLQVIADRPEARLTIEQKHIVYFPLRWRYTPRSIRMRRSKIGSSPTTLICMSAL
jgi:hypothetical protein